MTGARIRVYAAAGLSAAAGAVAYPHLPADARLPGFEAGDGSSLARAMVAWLLPAASVLIVEIVERLRDRDRDPASDEAGSAIVCRVVVFLAALQITLIGAALGWFSGRAWAARVVPAEFGVALVSIGNLLPRLRPAAGFGIRTSRTLSDRTAWIQAHRLAGFLLVAVGAAMIGAALILPPGPAVRNLVSLTAAAAAILFAMRRRRFARG